MFGDDTLPLDQSLEIQSATVLFTDVTGSTQLYERLGDTVIVVTLNDRLDYFGRTVNIAARVQQMSAPGEVSMLEEVVRAPGVTALLRERVSKVYRSTTRLKGIDDTARLYRAKISQTKLSGPDRSF